ncbi:MAG TPA: PilX N-terminal domain-containing pilus assembly protein [Baekduia sp.]|nr:PilX N-terminal domain-containing pilus assembly protein [Baekduia sp.]
MTSRRLPDPRAEDGIALVVAMLLMFFMLTIGLAAIQLSDSQSSLTAKQRQRETSFNVAEAALNAQVTQIAHHWIGINGSTGAATPFTPCPGGSYCPDSTELTSMIPSADTKQPVDWRTQVFDNSDGLESYFSDASVGTQCGCDFNNDGKVWVRSQATVRGHLRTIVSLVQQQTQAESVPHAAIIAGSLSITNNGQHGGNVIIDTNGGLLATRCSPPPWTPTVSESSSTPCMGQPEGVGSTRTEDRWNALLNSQVEGFGGYQPGYDPDPLFSQDQVNRFLNTARAEGTYYTSCPSTLTGEVVVVDVAGQCSYNGNGSFNTQSDPGFVIFLNASSSLSLGGTRTFYGVVYHANMGNAPIVGSATQSTGTLVSLDGNAKIFGGVLIDGPGRVEAGSSAAPNIFFDDHGYDAVRSYAGAGIIQNSWREITPGA